MLSSSAPRCESQPELCSVCFMEPDGDDEGCAVPPRMASCAASHYICQDCAESFLRSSLASVSQGLVRQWKDSKTLPCPLSSKESCCCLTTRDFFEIGSVEVSQAICDLSQCLSSTVAQDEVTTRMIQKESGGDDGEGAEGGGVARGKGSNTLSANSSRLVQHIKDRIDELCTASIACPHCSAPFLDFSGCMALTCGSCGREFCGVCLSINHYDTTSIPRRVPVKDAHAQVLLCLQRYDPKMLATYGMTQGSYFISNSEGINWERWKDRIKATRLLEYLFTIKKDVLWRVYDEIERHIVANKLMNDEEIAQLKTKVFSHEASAQHLVRIPVLFWLLYASKIDCSFREAMEDADKFMGQADKIEVGRLCVAKMREVYPSWQAVRVRVPGESFEAINYPPEALSLITSVIDEWGTRKGIWSGVGTLQKTATIGRAVDNNNNQNVATVAAPAPAAAAAAVPAPRGRGGNNNANRGRAGGVEGGRGGYRGGGRGGNK